MGTDHPFWKTWGGDVLNAVVDVNAIPAAELIATLRSVLDEAAQSKNSMVVFQHILAGLEGTTLRIEILKLLLGHSSPALQEIGQKNALHGGIFRTNEKDAADFMAFLRTLPETMARTSTIESLSRQFQTQLPPELLAVKEGTTGRTSEV